MPLNPNCIPQDEVIHVHLRIESNFPREVVATEIALSFEVHNKDALPDIPTSAAALHSYEIPHTEKIQKYIQVSLALSV